MRRLDVKRLTQNIEKIACSDLVTNKVFGSAYSIWQGDQNVYEKCFGKVSWGEAQTVTRDTLFRLASMTKPVTAVATLLLTERKLLSLTDPVAMYLPEFEKIHIITADGQDLGRPQKQPDILQILTHTSGIGSEDLKLRRRTAEDSETLNSYIGFGIRSGLDYEPGTRQMYSGSVAFDVLTRIIEIVSGMDYQSFLQKEIFEPCGMRDTTFVPTVEQWSRMIDMHTRTDDGKSAVHCMKDGCVFVDFPCTHYLGGAGLVSTLGDYMKFARMLLKKGQIGNVQLLEEDTLRMMCTPWVSADIMPGPQRWGLGVRVITDAAYGTLPVGSFGWSGAYGSHFWIDPENEMAVVYLKNSMIDGGAGNVSACELETAVYSALITE